ncbi:hypothetical protein [Nocardia farcinica]|uniref:Uncharacterized protein n=1 Tax=Nocardia farcinica (strain IFM 10152) TaxID=247156 RepID=Q5YSF1_NOCFA|nr:hypothetical protein [Nocardia farcinica]BAD58890.1 hypothetical protein NFA_40420 [Nocardia farcinica IFM 10152]
MTVNRIRTSSQVPVLGEYKRRKVRLLREAKGIPSLVDIEPLRDHLRWLSSLGFSDDALGRGCGLSHNAIRRIRLDDVGQRHVQITRAARIRTLTHVPVPAQADTWVPALGAIRRIHALQAIGYTTRDLADYLNTPQQGVSQITKRTRIYGSTWLRVRDVYDELSGTPGPSRTGEKKARDRGFAPPIAWEDVDIDHPDSAPIVDTAAPSIAVVDDVFVARILAGEHRGPIPAAERAAVLDHAVAHGWIARQLANALGINRGAADRALVRHRARLRKRQQEAA